MEQKEMIALFEEVMDKRFNEETIGSIVDEKLKSLLEPVDKGQVRLGDQAHQEQPKGMTFSQWLGDMARVSRGSAPIWSKDGQKDFIQAVTNIDQQYLASLAPEQAKSLYEASGAAGGYLVPTEEMRILIDLTTNWSVVAPLCTQVPMRTNSITFPTLTSGLTAYWIPEAQSSSPSSQAEGVKQESTPTFSQMNITNHVLAVLVYVSNQMLDDSDPAVDGVLYNIFGKTLAKYLDIAVLRGAGTATDPVTGLANRVTTNKLQTGAQLDFDDILDLIYGVLDNSDGGTTQVDLIGHTKAERQLLKVKDNDGQYVYRRPADPTKGSPSLWGEPWHRDNNISTTLGTESDKTRIFGGDFGNHAYVGMRNQVSIRANPWGTGFTQNQTAFLAEFRRGFQVDDESRFSLLEGVPTA